MIHVGVVARAAPLFRRGWVEGVHKAQSRTGIEFPDDLHPSTSGPGKQVGGRGPIRPAPRLIITSRAVVAEQSEQPSLHHVEVDMPIVVRMKVSFDGLKVSYPIDREALLNMASADSSLSAIMVSPRGDEARNVTRRYLAPGLHLADELHHRR